MKLNNKLEGNFVKPNQAKEVRKKRYKEDAVINQQTKVFLKSVQKSEVRLASSKKRSHLCSLSTLS